MKIPKEILELSEESLIEMLIEESGELIQVLAKRLRIIRGENVTPVRMDENYRHCTEEFTDVSLCMDVLNAKKDGTLYNKKIIAGKLARWKIRLERRHDA